MPCDAIRGHLPNTGLENAAGHLNERLTSLTCFTWALKDITLGMQDRLSCTVEPRERLRTCHLIVYE